MSGMQKTSATPCDIPLMIRECECARFKQSTRERLASGWHWVLIHICCYRGNSSAQHESPAVHLPVLDPVCIVILMESKSNSERLDQPWSDLRVESWTGEPSTERC
jgi:hypothetical protein